MELNDDLEYRVAVRSSGGRTPCPRPGAVRLRRLPRPEGAIAGNRQPLRIGSARTWRTSSTRSRRNSSPCCRTASSAPNALIEGLLEYSRVGADRRFECAGGYTQAAGRDNRLPYPHPKVFDQAWGRSCLSFKPTGCCWDRCFSIS